MAILTCNSITQPQILASSSSSPPNKSSSSSTSSSPNFKPNQPLQQQKRKIVQQQQQQQQQQPTILEIERAIGAGIFRDRDPNRGEDGESNMLDNLMKNSVGKNEGDVEKKLRETGEWLLRKSEMRSNSAGKQILIAMFLWILPTWIIALLFASGIVQLPYNTPFLEDLFS